MTIPERVSKFLLEQKPAAFCDDCIAERVGLSRRQQAHRVTSALETTTDFLRNVGTCSSCGTEKKVIQAA